MSDRKEPPLASTDDPETSAIFNAEALEQQIIIWMNIVNPNTIHKKITRVAIKEFFDLGYNVSDVLQKRINKWMIDNH